MFQISVFCFWLKLELFFFFSFAGCWIFWSNPHMGLLGLVLFVDWWCWACSVAWFSWILYRLDLICFILRSMDCFSELESLVISLHKLDNHSENYWTNSKYVKRVFKIYFSLTLILKTPFKHISESSANKLNFSNPKTKWIFFGGIILVTIVSWYFLFEMEALSWCTEEEALILIKDLDWEF